MPQTVYEARAKLAALSRWRPGSPEVERARINLILTRVEAEQAKLGAELDRIEAELDQAETET